jgi:hypothetical protein
MSVTPDPNRAAPAEAAGAHVASRTKRALSALFVLATITLLVTAFLAFRIRCEGFGCMGVGIVWMAWVAAYVLVLVASVVLRATLPRATRLRGAVSIASFALWLLGAALFLYWALQRAA